MDSTIINSSFNNLTNDELIEKIMNPFIMNICSYDILAQKEINNKNIHYFMNTLLGLFTKIYSKSKFYLNYSESDKISSIMCVLFGRNFNIEIIPTPNIICSCCQTLIELHVVLVLSNGYKNIIFECHSIQEVIQKLNKIIN